MRINMGYRVPATPAEVIAAAEEWLQTDTPDLPLERSGLASGGESVSGRVVSDVTEIVTTFEASPHAIGTELRVKILMRGIGLKGKLHQLTMLPSRGIVKDYSRQQMDAFVSRWIPSQEP